MMLSDDMDTNLREYYRWTLSQNPGDIGYPHGAAVLSGAQSIVSSAGLSDEEAQWIDNALCQLKKEQPGNHIVIDKIYGEQKSLRQLEKAGYGDRKTLAQRAWQAREFVRGVLFGATMHS